MRNDEWAEVAVRQVALVLLLEVILDSTRVQR
jgi:hypothetical protein